MAEGTALLLLLYAAVVVPLLCPGTPFYRGRNLGGQGTHKAELGGVSPHFWGTLSTSPPPIATPTSPRLHPMPAAV